MDTGKQIWVQQGTAFTHMAGPLESFDKLPKGIYKVSTTPMGEFFLSWVMSDFQFGYRLYGLQTDFINHVIKTFENTNGNLGILLNGTKGTGKTVTAKMLANKLNLPVIIVQNMGNANQSMMNWLSTEISFDCIFFFDEYEKTFGKDTNILSFMDGVYNQPSRKVFLLTTNTLNVDENLLNRPSRIAYLKTFNNLPKETVSEYLDDKLKDKTVKQQLMEFIDTLKISTIDILKSIVTEVNIHGIEEFIRFRKSFNVQTEVYEYHCTLGYIDLSRKGARKTTIQDFLHDKERIYDDYVPEPRERDFMRSDGTINATAFRNAYNDWYKEHKETNFRFTSTNLTTEVRFQHLKVGQTLDNGETIADIDTKHNVLVTLSEDEISFYEIKNPDGSPSLWNASKAIGYGVDGYTL